MNTSSTETELSQRTIVRLLDELRIRGTNVRPGTPVIELVDMCWAKCPTVMKELGVAPDREPPPPAPRAQAATPPAEAAPPVLVRETMSEVLPEPPPKPPVLDLLTPVRRVRPEPEAPKAEEPKAAPAEPKHYVVTRDQLPGPLDWKPHLPPTESFGPSKRQGDFIREQRVGPAGFPKASAIATGPR